MEDVSQTAPEKKLLIAVLRRALYDYRSSSLAARAEASDWIFDDDAKGRFSFRWVCEQLELDSQRFRSWVKSLRYRKGFQLAKCF